MYFLYRASDHYVFALILFTIATKLIFIPLAVWVHKNSIKLVKMQPEIYQIKARFYGDAERIAEEQASLFKKHKYSPFYDLLPLFLQIVLLIGVIQILYNPLSYVLNLQSGDIALLIAKTAEITGMDPQVASAQITVLNTMQNPAYTQEFLTLATAENIQNIVADVLQLDTVLLGINLTSIPINEWGILLFVPLLAGLSSLFLSFMQNRINVLQAEQSAVLKYSTTGISVALSLYLGLFVPAGVALYWILGNLYAVLQLIILNAIMNPKKYLDYAELVKSRKALEEINSLGPKKSKWYEKDENAKREKADYKRFFSIASKKIVFYSENKGFYKYFEGVINELLRRCNLPIHYITSDPHDKIFELAKTQTRIKPYYIGEKRLITLFMKMDAQIVLMTMPDLQNYHYKRSLVKKDVHYIFMPHWITSTNMVVRKGALEHFDAVFCVGKHWVNEIEKSETVYGTKKKELVQAGYSLLEKLTQDYDAMDKSTNEVPQILIAPSWQEDNIMDSCIDDILHALLKTTYKIIVRPHPEYCKRYPGKIDAFAGRYTNRFGENFEFQTDFSSNTTIYSSDILVTDWSNTAFEFSLSTKKASIFVNTKRKVMNPDYKEITDVPMDLVFRDLAGESIEVQDVASIDKLIHKILDRPDEYSKKIQGLIDEYIFHFGDCSKISAEYLLDYLKSLQKCS